MNEILIEAFRHKLWAMKTLINACKDLPLEKLTNAGPRYGSIIATLNHIVMTDARYAASLGCGRAEWAEEGNNTNDFRELIARADENGERWEQFLKEPVNGEQIAYLDNGTYETHASVVLMQALHHVSAHGEQVCSILKAIGIDPPDIQPWELADQTGRSRWIQPK